MISINGKDIREIISTERDMGNFFIKQLVIKSAVHKLKILSIIQSFESKIERKKNYINLLAVGIAITGLEGEFRTSSAF